MSQTATVCLLTDECIHVLVLESRGRTPRILTHAQETYPLPDSLLVDHDPDQLAAAIAGAVKSTGAWGAGITLVLPLQWCFTHVLRATRKRTTEQMLAYDLEQYLPVPVEDLTCAFLPLGQGSVLAAAVPSAPLAGLLAGLLRNDIAVEHIAIDALAAASALPASTGASNVLICDARWGRLAARWGKWENATLAVFGVCSGQDLGAKITEHIGPCMTHGEATAERWTILNLRETVPEVQWQRAIPVGDGTANVLAPVEAVETIASAVTFGAPAPDLRTGSLATEGRWDRALRLAEQCIACAILLVLVLAGGMYLHTRSLEKHLAAVRQAQKRVYQAVFQGEGALPPGAAMRLASERVRLEGLTRVSAAPATQSAEPALEPMSVLRETVAGLPGDVRVMLLDARLDSRQMSIRGQTAEHRDAERIVEVINRLPGIVAHPPRTTRLKTGGVEFSIIAAGASSDGRTANPGS